jgi:N-acetyl sugar amidotransferase
MDTSDPEIVFDERGECNHCRLLSKQLAARPPLSTRKQQLEAIVERIRAEGKGREYDCLMGVSGGVDSTYVAYLMHQYGLRPLAIHLDNGWNSELAVSNIKKALDKCGVDLVTHVIDWEEFKDLQLSFLKASIPGMEIPTDHAIVSLLYRESQKHRIRYVMSGSNQATEGIMARSWSEGAGQRDWKLVRSVHKQFGSKPLRTFPHFSMFGNFYYKALLRNVNVCILDYLDYNKTETMRVLQEELGWIYYGGKHYESIYTRFTQGYIQPRKFGFDKRRAHLSALIVSGEITREQALEELAGSPYADPQLEQQDLEIFKKKLGLSDEDFDKIMRDQPKSFLDYPCYTKSPTAAFLNSLALRFHAQLKKTSYYGDAQNEPFTVPIQSDRHE